MPLCANHCGKDFSEYADWWIEHTTPEEDADGREIAFRSGLCSVGCLIEFAWKIREKQPKLSKSTQTIRRVAEGEEPSSATADTGDPHA